MRAQRGVRSLVMNLRTFFVGFASGACAAYALVRTIEAIRPPATLQRDAHAYGTRRRALALSAVIRSNAGALAFAYGPLAPRMARALRRLPPFVRASAFAAIASALSSAVDIPTALVEEHGVERRFGLTDQRRAAFAAEAVKSALLSAGVTSIIAGCAAGALRAFPRKWPLVGALGAFPLYVLATLIVPIYVMPLFNRFEPLEGPLEAQLRALATEHGVGDADILRMDMSRQTNKANAFVAGLGRTHRIVLGDTLIDHFEPDEIEFVIAHEIGHYVSRDTWRLIAVAECATALLLLVVSRATPPSTDDELVRLARISALLNVGMQFLRPALAAFSRSREWAADRFAVRATNDPGAGARAFARLRDRNLAEDGVPAWYELFFGSHPSIGKRISALERATTT